MSDLSELYDNRAPYTPDTIEQGTPITVPQQVTAPLVPLVPSVLSLDTSVRRLVTNTANAFIGVVAEMYNGQDFLTTLHKENRYMYLALLVILYLIIGDIMDAWNL